MPSISYGPEVDRGYREELELILERVASLFMLDLLIVEGVRPAVGPRERGEGLHRKGRALDFQVRGYEPQGERPLENIFYSIIAHTHQIIEGIVADPSCCQMVYHPGDDKRGPHIHLALPHAHRRFERVDSVVVSLEERIHLRRGTPTPVIILPDPD